MTEETSPSTPTPWGAYVFLFFVFLLLSPSLVKAVDVVYAAGYMAIHWSDSETFSPGAQFCKKWFCVRTDTVEKHVTGTEGYTSEETMYFCPIHRPPLALTFFHETADFGALDVPIFLAFWGFTIGWLWLLWGIATLAITAPLRLMLPGKHPFPGQIVDESEEEAGSQFNTIALTTAVVLTGITMFAYGLW